MPTKLSKLEEDLLFQIQVSGLPEPICQYKIFEYRKYTADFAWPDQMVIAECEGGTWSVGGHSTGTGIERDCLKANLAQMDGWTYLRFTSGMIRDTTAIETLKAVLGYSIQQQVNGD